MTSLRRSTPRDFPSWLKVYGHSRADAVSIDRLKAKYVGDSLSPADMGSEDNHVPPDDEASTSNHGLQLALPATTPKLATV
nr:unnamed protein product [Fasciola hepatica]